VHQSALKGGFDWLRKFMAAEQSPDDDLADGRTNVSDRSIKEAIDKEAASRPTMAAEQSPVDKEDGARERGAGGEDGSAKNGA
jgi:hypothetical protein